MRNLWSQFGSEWCQPSTEICLLASEPRLWEAIFNLKESQKNQRINDFNKQGESLAKILTAMVLMADSKGDDPTIEKQRLLWVVAPDPDNPSNKIVLITTRKAAEQRYTIPEIFLPK